MNFQQVVGVLAAPASPVGNGSMTGRRRRSRRRLKQLKPRSRHRDIFLKSKVPRLDPRLARTA
jgi:hypothetical protein